MAIIKAAIIKLIVGAKAEFTVVIVITTEDLQMINQTKHKTRDAAVAIVDYYCCCYYY